MALIKFGPGILDARGSIGGVTFSKNSTSHYIRARVKPVNPNTERQDDVRSAMAFCTDRWSQTVTNAQRLAWNDYAAGVAMKNKLGEAVYLSGFNHYLRGNVLRKTFGWPLVDAGPVILELPAQDPALAITASEATQQIEVTFDDTMDWDNETGGYMVMFQGKPQNPQRNFFGGPWRMCHAVQGVTAAPVASPVLATVAYAIAELQRQWLYARIIRADGRLSEPFRADCFVAA